MTLRSFGGIFGKWAAIALFCSGRWAILGIIAIACPEPPSEPAIKDILFHQRPIVDTVVVGDSRVLRISESPFSRRGWSFFNMGMSGLSPEDILLQLEFALAHGSIRRVILGVSFESMSESFPFEFSRYHDDPLFRDLDLSSYGSLEPDSVFHSKAWLHLKAFLRKVIYPPIWASSRLKDLFAAETSVFLPNGNAAYSEIVRAMRDGTMDFRSSRDPSEYFNRDDSEARYLKTRRLSAHAIQIYEGIFAKLRARGISCVVFETGRRPEYQAMIDAYPVLSRLQGEWREFFRTQSSGGIRVLALTDIAAEYDLDDFFDACHFVGLTGDRLGERLANELADLDREAGRHR